MIKSPISFFKYQIARLTGARYPFCDFGYVPSDFTSSVSSAAKEVSTTATTPDPSDPMRWEHPLELEPQLPYATHSQTASYSLCDSPSGLLAWLIDALRLPASAHSTKASAAAPWTPTDLLNWTMMQWLPGPEAGLRWLANARRESATLWDAYSAVPLGISCFRGNGRPRAEPDVEAGEGPGSGSGPPAETTAATAESEVNGGAAGGGSGGDAKKDGRCCCVTCSPPLWAQAVQKLTWVKRHGRCSARPGWEEAGETGVDMREWAGQLVGEGWMRVVVRG